MSEEMSVTLIEGTQGPSDPAELAWAFPDVNAGQAPFGGRVIVQLRRVKKTVNGGRIILVAETKESEKWNNMIGKVISVGPLAFKNRETMAPWPEGKEKPPAAAVHKLTGEQSWYDAPELGPLGQIFLQDSHNMPNVQLGLKTKQPPYVWYSAYQEGKIRNFHENYDRWMGLSDEA